MENFTLKLFSSKVNHIFKANRIFKAFIERKYSANAAPAPKQKKQIHPYKSIHPWKSLEHFSQELVDNVIYNKDGLVVLNKPYGISGKKADSRQRDASIAMKNTIANSVEYTLTDAIPHIARAFNYPSLTIVQTPEKYISGITLLAANTNVKNAVGKSLRRAACMYTSAKTYWVVTTRMPKEKEGKKCLGITVQKSSCGTVKRSMIVTTWTSRSVKQNEVKKLTVEFKVLSSATQNLAALLEIKTSTTHWHAIRLFAATILYSPILGDRIHGSRIKEVMGTWMLISPFSNAVEQPPRLNLDLLKLLRLSTEDTLLIPAHIHQRQILLPQFFNAKEDLILRAPLTPEFLWTCERLDLKYNVNSEENTKCTDTS